ncbi:MAG TPA: presqualene diphosphate synthase HpnD [Verrucomicrobiae bacterium]|nr:presqualene diphosphate synthase HpnD [Verrucomicrobiae bacterium]
MQESRTITRRSASNLALAFFVLPKHKRDGMSALYAFCREVDDIADNEAVPLEERREALNRWRADVARACGEDSPEMAVNKELQPFIHQHHLPFGLFDELIRGVEMDLEIKRYETYEQLEQYCYRVASVVGLLSIEIFGYTDPATREYANALGKALQLTNILCDVRADAEQGRIYLPRVELARFKISEDEILRFKYTERFYALASDVAQHARRYYQRAREILPEQDRRSMAAAELMGSVYWRLLRKLELQRFNVFGPNPTRVSSGQKLLLILRTLYRMLSGAVVPNYGRS